MSWDRRRGPKGMSQMEQVMQHQRDMEVGPTETGVEYHVTGQGNGASEREREIGPN